MREFCDAFIVWLGSYLVSLWMWVSEMKYFAGFGIKTI